MNEIVPLRELTTEEIENFNDYRSSYSSIIKSNDLGIVKSKRTFGVELECYNNKSKKAYITGLANIHERFGMKSDGTIDGDYCREVVTCKLAGKAGEDALRHTCNVLYQTGFRADNGSCGTHVHIGIPEAHAMKGEDEKEKRLRLLALLYSVFDPAIVCLIQKNRRSNRFCQQLGTTLVKIDKDKKDVMGAWKLHDKLKYACENYTNIDQEAIDNRKKGKRLYFHGKYYGINIGGIYSQRNTLEVRYLGGTLDPDEILHWIAFHSAIIDTVLIDGLSEQEILKNLYITREKELFEKLIEIVKLRLDPETITNIKARFKKHNKTLPKGEYIRNR